jgi:prepilin-type N-terminal cleavage/methylation domain-containing protein
MKPSLIMNSKGFTLIELLIACAIGGIGLVVLFGFVTGNSPIQTKQSCMNAGGKWSEGIQYGRLTQLCTYN